MEAYLPKVFAVVDRDLAGTVERLRLSVNEWSVSGRKSFAFLKFSNYFSCEFKLNAPGNIWISGIN